MIIATKKIATRGNGTHTISLTKKERSLAIDGEVISIVASPEEIDRILRVIK